MPRKLRLLPAPCALDLGDGSERGEYVCQDYILNVLGRPHRAVNIMYTYYPNDEQWPQRISEACADMEVNFAWDYPYDDYPTYADDGPQFEQMRDIRRHGQDVMLTITMDCAVTDEQIRHMARPLAKFGRMMLRINHECNGNWFTHNKRFSYEEIADFFIRASKIVKEEAPNVRTVFCAGLAKPEDEADDDDMVDREDVFAGAYKAADIWSADKYIALHFGWPYDVAEAGGGSYEATDPLSLFDRYERTYKRLSALFGDKPFIQAEIGADGDVTGPLGQATPVTKYYRKVRDEKAGWITGLSMYQFRDRGRLGLEIEDVNNPSVGIKQPILDGYKEILSDPYFSPRFETGEETAFPAVLRWGGSEDADGIVIDVEFDGTPEFCEVTLQNDLSLMMEFNGRWFYKSPGVSTIDLMSSFFDRPLEKKAVIHLRIFATPPSGENIENCSGWENDQYFEMKEEPVFRIRYEVPLRL